MKKFLPKIGLVFGSTVLALTLAELAVRLLDVPPRPLAPLPVPSYRLSDDPAVGYEFRPNYKPDQKQWDREHQGYAVNAAGFRDYDYSEEKPPGTYRIAMLGDSTTAGNGIPNVANTYPKLLERALNTPGGGRRKIEVMNMAAAGYQTMQEVALFRNKGLRYHPDMVTILVCMNDLSLHADGGIYDFLVRANKGGVRSAVNPVGRWLLHHSRLAFILHHRYLAAPLDSDEWYETHILEGKSPVRAGFELFSQLQQEPGFKAMIFILPDFRFPFDKYELDWIHREVTAAAAGLPGITLIDLKEHFRTVDSDARKFSYDGCHMNETGHRVLATVLLSLIPHP